MNFQPEDVLLVFQKSIQDWHTNLAPSNNPYEKDSMNFILYSKSHIDTIQWHVEDEIRRADIPDSDIATLKRRIDALNQERTNLVEVLDDYFLNLYKDVKVKPGARMNSETPAWLIDRMSILELKIYHMKEQTERKDADSKHISQCQAKLDILLDQRKDMSNCLLELLDDLNSGHKYMKVYRQMKMYNDKNLNPSLYTTSNK
jgi:hypothetical protein